MRISEIMTEGEERENGGRFFREMLRDVKPQHVGEMISMLQRLRHTEKQIEVPEQGRWMLKMPHGYGLLGEGPFGFYIDPPPDQTAARPANVDGGAVAKLDYRDTQGILELCEQARRAKRPERDRLLAQLYALDLDRCQTKAVEAVELVTFDLIVNETE